MLLARIKEIIRELNTLIASDRHYPSDEFVFVCLEKNANSLLSTMEVFTSSITQANPQQRKIYLDLIKSCYTRLKKILDDLNQIKPSIESRELLKTVISDLEMIKAWLTHENRMLQTEREESNLKFYVNNHGELVSSHKDEERAPEITHPNKYQYDVFICYSKTDLNIALSIYNDFINAGINAWIDDKKIRGGDYITKKIEEGLRNSRYIIVLLSPESATSNWCRMEYSAYLNLEFTNKIGKKVIPLVIKPCSTSQIPLWLIDKKQLNYSNKREYYELIQSAKNHSL